MASQPVNNGQDGQENENVDFSAEKENLTNILQENELEKCLPVVDLLTEDKQFIILTLLHEKDLETDEITMESTEKKGEKKKEPGKKERKKRQKLALACCLFYLEKHNVKLKDTRWNAGYEEESDASLFEELHELTEAIYRFHSYDSYEFFEEVIEGMEEHKKQNGVCQFFPSVISFYLTVLLVLLYGKKTVIEALKYVWSSVAPKNDPVKGNGPNKADDTFLSLLKYCWSSQPNSSTSMIQQNSASDIADLACRVSRQFMKMWDCHLFVLKNFIADLLFFSSQEKFCADQIKNDSTMELYSICLRRFLQREASHWPIDTGMKNFFESGMKILLPQVISLRYTAFSLKKLVENSSNYKDFQTEMCERIRNKLYAQTELGVKGDSNNATTEKKTNNYSSPKKLNKSKQETLVLNILNQRLKEKSAPKGVFQQNCDKDASEFAFNVANCILEDHEITKVFKKIFVITQNIPKNCENFDDSKNNGKLFYGTAKEFLTLKLMKSRDVLPIFVDASAMGKTDDNLLSVSSTSIVIWILCTNHLRKTDEQSAGLHEMKEKFKNAEEAVNWFTENHTNEMKSLGQNKNKTKEEKDRLRELEHNLADLQKKKRFSQQNDVILDNLQQKKKQLKNFEDEKKLERDKKNKEIKEEEDRLQKSNNENVAELLKKKGDLKEFNKNNNSDLTKKRNEIKQDEELLKEIVLGKIRRSFIRIVGLAEETTGIYRNRKRNTEITMEFLDRIMGIFFKDICNNEKSQSNDKDEGLSETLKLEQLVKLFPAASGTVTEIVSGCERNSIQSEATVVSSIGRYSEHWLHIKGKPKRKPEQEPEASHIPIFLKTEKKWLKQIVEEVETNIDLGKNVVVTTRTHYLSAISDKLEEKFGLKMDRIKLIDIFSESATSQDYCDLHVVSSCFPNDECDLERLTGHHFFPDSTFTWRFVLNIEHAPLEAKLSFRTTFWNADNHNDTDVDKDVFTFHRRLHDIVQQRQETDTRTYFDFLEEAHAFLNAAATETSDEREKKFWEEITKKSVWESFSKELCKDVQLMSKRINHSKEFKLAMCLNDHTGIYKHFQDVKTMGDIDKRVRIAKSVRTSKGNEEETVIHYVGCPTKHTDTWKSENSGKKKFRFKDHLAFQVSAKNKSIPTKICGYQKTFEFDATFHLDSILNNLSDINKETIYRAIEDESELDGILDMLKKRLEGQEQLKTFAEEFAKKSSKPN